MLSSDNPVLRSLSYFVSNRALAVGSIYGVTTARPVSVIKRLKSGLSLHARSYSP